MLKRLPNYKKNSCENINKVGLGNNDFIYHAGTRIKNDKVYSNGGRVLNITSIGNVFMELKKILSIINKINWKDGL